jgi:hypothetical protein
MLSIVTSAESTGYRPRPRVYLQHLVVVLPPPSLNLAAEAAIHSSSSLLLSSRLLVCLRLFQYQFPVQLQIALRLLAKWNVDLVF